MKTWIPASAGMTENRAYMRHARAGRYLEEEFRDDLYGEFCSWLATGENLTCGLFVNPSAQAYGDDLSTFVIRAVDNTRPPHSQTPIPFQLLLQWLSAGYSGSQLGASLSVIVEMRHVASLRRCSWLHANETRYRSSRIVVKAARTSRFKYGCKCRMISRT